VKPQIFWGLAAGLLIGCGGTGSLRPQGPAPDDEVSVGYGTQSKRNVTGAVTSIVLTEADTRAARMEQLLQGRVPGLEVRRLPDGNYTLRIRGRHSLRGSATDDEPLLVIDGIPVPAGSLGTTLAGLVPDDVARIDVLKDAMAGIYGSRGANGVILITTKRGP
jgi:TonB-dependent SusC/RagA subfamily outer membrane receptor